MKGLLDEFKKFENGMICSSRTVCTYRTYCTVPYRTYCTRHWFL